MLTSLSPKNRRGLVSKCAAFAIALCAFAISAKAEAVSIIGNANGSLATASLNCTFNAQTNTFTFTLMNTSPFDARITGVGFDLLAGDFSGSGSWGLNGFSGANVGNFTFADGALVTSDSLAMPSLTSVSQPAKAATLTQAVPTMASRLEAA